MTVQGSLDASLIGAIFPIELVSRGDQTIDRRRFETPVPVGRPFARRICSRFESLTVDRPDMWTPAQANKAASANQLPA